MSESRESVALYHVTSNDLLASIVANGVNAPSYWTNDEDVADYYAETISDEGKSPVTVTTHLHLLDERALQPDMESIAEPITGAIGKSEEEVAEEWSDAERGDWRDSLRIVMSIRVIAVVPADRIWVAD
jgi:hypothetical protein